MASSSDRCVKVKEEMDDDFDQSAGHSHTFTVQFKNKNEKLTVLCVRLCTVLEAMESNERIRAKITTNENIVIQSGTGDEECTIATHFPCTWLKEKENLVVLQTKENIERKTEEGYFTTYPKEKYAIFYIDNVFGLNAKTKQVFRNNILKKYKYTCIYGDKEMSVEEALQRDGRFVDDLGSFYLTNINDNMERTECTANVKVLHGKKLKICMDRVEGGVGKLQITPGAKNSGKRQRTPGAKGSGKLQITSGAITFQGREVAHQKGVRVMRAEQMANDHDIEEVRQTLRDQFPQLKAQMEERFRQTSYKEILELKKEHFGKIQQSFTEVYRVRELLELGKSVCKIVVGWICMGTGFVLFDDLILTNAHLFDQVKKNDHVEIYVLFDYEKPEPKTDYCTFLCEEEFIDIDIELDYAVLKLCPEGERSNPQSQKRVVRPPGLLKEFGPVPENGEACIIGHPNGGVKKMDPTCIIEMEQRINAINQHLSQYKDSTFIIQSVEQVLINKGIENIMEGQAQADQCVTYNTFMYHGSSGSPVLDHRCQVFGLHSAGFTYGWPEGFEESVIEYAHPLLLIFRKFVSKLRKKKDETLLARIAEVAKENGYLKEVLDLPHTPDPADTLETMELS